MAEKLELPLVEVPPRPPPRPSPQTRLDHPPTDYSQMQLGPACSQPAQMTATGYPPQPMVAQLAQITTTGYPQQAHLALHPHNVVYHAQPQILQSGTSTVVVQTASKSPIPPMSAAYARSFTVLGAVQIAVGCFCFIFNIIGQASDLEAFYVGAGYWAGALFILTGVFGVLSGKKTTNCGSPKCYVVTFLVLSILMPCLFVVAVLTQASFGLILGLDCYYYYCKESASIAWNTLLIIAAAVELVSSIVSSAYCCGFLCCRKYITTTGYPEKAQLKLQPQNVVYQAQPQMMTAGTSTVVVQTAPKSPIPPMSAAYARSFTILGAVQIAVGCLCFIFNIIGQASDLQAFYVGAGYWAGGLFIVTGVFGVLSGKKKTSCGSRKCYVVTFLVLSILMPCLFVAAVLTQASFGLVMRVDCDYRCDSYDWYTCHYYCDDSKESASIAWNSLLIIAAAVELVSSIVSSAYCCGFLCCRKYLTGQVRYMQGNKLVLSEQPQGQQVILSGQPIPQQGQQFVLSVQPLQQKAQQVLFPGQTTQHEQQQQQQQQQQQWQQQQQQQHLQQQLILMLSGQQ